MERSAAAPVCTASVRHSSDTVLLLLLPLSPLDLCGKAAHQPARALLHYIEKFRYVFAHFSALFGAANCEKSLW